VEVAEEGGVGVGLVRDVVNCPARLPVRGDDGGMWEIEIQPVPLERLAGLLAPERAQRLAENADIARRVLRGRTVWNINATGRGGGVAEMLQTLLAYGRGAQVDTRWLVLDGDSEFFTITKRLHNVLHGTPGDGGPLGPEQRTHFEQVLLYNLPMAKQVVRSGDIVLLHDPQTAGLTEGLQERGAHVIWRCHIGRDETNELTDLGWDFLRGFIHRADAFIFSRREYVPDWIPPERVLIIPPSVDPFSAKNVELTGEETRGALGQAGLVDVPFSHTQLAFTRRDGSRGRVRPHRELVLDAPPLPGDARVVMQVSRWDRLKDMPGVLRGFADHVDRFPPDVQLALVGPETSGVTDDPEGAEVLEECRELWKGLPDATRDRVRLICLPMDDVDENAHLVNALQHHATVVVQKSLVEGFGLTVTEAMWKGRPVVASAIGGIRDQIEDGVHGLLLPDPTDLDAFAAALERLFDDPAWAESLGVAAKERVQEQFLGDRHLIQYVELFQALTEEETRHR
jgi:trehalose synthase